jgi:two-component system, OmpR family, sensor kinase
MKIFKSIKWRLQLWYGLILVVVLAGFGGTAYQLERGRQLRRVDGELHRRFDLLARALHSPPRRQNFEQRDFNRPPPGQFPEDGLPEHGFEQPQRFYLPPEAAALFGTNTSSDFYFQIDGRDKKGIARMGNFPGHTSSSAYEFIRGNPELGPNNMKPPKSIGSGEFQELFDLLPSGEFVLVGCSIAPELKELRRTALNLTAVGGVILFVGLVGGWWFVGRSLRPIAEISSTAVKISAGDLSQRINVAEAESELGELAAVLNSTFARLETAFAQQKQFASDAAHELRTPVTVILTQTQLALSREREAADYKQTIEACQRAAQRMRKLIESLLELARFDAGQEVLRRLPFDFAGTVADSVELVQTLAEEKKVKISSDLAPLEITGDSGRLAQVVTNLLTNAIQHNQPEGEVLVKLEAQGGLAVLEISDTGNGIAPEDLPRVFERFYRADQSRTGNGNSGLGLSICKAIVEAHGGTIEVASQENAGTTFTVRLPV